MVGVDGPEQLAHCSFCGKSQKAVGKLIAGPERGLDGARAAYICNECVALCAEIIAEEGLDAGPPARPSDAPPG